MKAKNLIGQKFGRLTVVERGQNTKSGKCTWLCDCDCGKRKETPVGSYELTSGSVRSCGCLYKESNKGRRVTHGKSKDRLYNIWSSMHQRCSTKNERVYRNYGGKGISVCDEWRDFKPFYDWAMTNGYSEKVTLDRKDNQKGYCPDNCRWSTMKEQQNNRTNNVRFSVNGEEKTLTEWSDITGIPSATLKWRLKNGWAENEMFIPVNLNNARIRKEKKIC